ncbi:MAG: phosphopyruvate hydratase [Deltaproteobacteria bacterium]|nr:phosphopyruvate hydratase [Deltaproteobacteria bacterium]
MKITRIEAYEIIDNRAMPTIRTGVCVDGIHWGWADVPCGSSTGSFEARELRDGDHRYRGKGVRRAIENIEKSIAPVISGMAAADQRALDNAMLDLDGTTDKSNLGANAILGVSLAAAKAAAVSLNLPLYRHLNPSGHVLPVPQASLLNGGLHAGNELDIQEYCVMPVDAGSFAEAVRMLSEIFMSLRDVLYKTIGPSAVNSSEDGGFAPPLKTSDQAMEILETAVAKAGYAGQVLYGLDLASTGFFNREKGHYTFEKEIYTRHRFIDYLKSLVQRFPLIVSLEDPLAEDDFEGFSRITAEMPGTMIIGDDLFATNRQRIKEGVEKKAANATLCKINQIGTLTEAMDAANFAREQGFAVVVSERSGETEDSILSDISVALNAGMLKTGGMRGSDRGAKYNRLIEIERELGQAARYAGRNYYC